MRSQAAERRRDRNGGLARPATRTNASPGKGSGSRLGKDRRPLVAIVDDEPDIVESLARLMPNDAYRTACYTSGLEFLASLEREPPDAVILDLVMPQPDGREILCQLRKRGLDGVRVLVITGSGEDAVADSVAAGATSGLVKPFHPRELLAKLESVLHD